MKSPQFDERYKLLNPEQKEAVDLIEGAVMVVAGPGTGKTQILTLRIANILLKTQINPENVLALTFTEAATKEMRRRLTEIIGTPGYRVDINTFHGFCNEVIRNNPEDFPHLISSEGVSDVEQIQLMEEIILGTDLQLLKPFGDQLYYLRGVLSAIGDLKKEAVSPQIFLKAVEVQEEDFSKTPDLYNDKGKYAGLMKGKYQDLQKSIVKNRELHIIYTRYQEELVKQHKYDFSDMLLEVLNNLEKDVGFKLKLQEKYQYVLIDEHQDTNSAQNKIVEYLMDFFEESPNLFVVGDEKQAIYRFQGASLENFLYFKKLYPTAKLIFLKNNYRSHQMILDSADSLISKNLTAGALSEEKIRLLAQKDYVVEKIKVGSFNDYFSEFEYVGEEIKRRQKDQMDQKGQRDQRENNDFRLSEVAIIGRQNRDLFVMAQTLERLGVPYSIAADTNVLNDPEIQKLLLLLKAVRNVGSELDLLKAMHVSFLDIEPLDVYRLVKLARERGVSVIDLLGESEDQRIGESEPEDGRRKTEVGKTEILKRVQDDGSIDSGLRQNDIIPDNIKFFFEKLCRWQRTCGNESFESLFVTVVNESGFKENFLKLEKRYEILDKLICLFEESRMLFDRNPHFGLGEFLDYIELCEKHDVALKQTVKTVNADAVNLMTAHRSKGLEFDQVFIIGVFDGHWGNSRKRSGSFKIPWDILGVTLNLSDDETEDERRLFYVAMTRARKSLMMSYSKRNLEGKEQIPSQFLGEIDEELLEEVDVSSFEYEFLRNKDKLFSFAEKDLSVSHKESSKEFFKELFLARGLSATGLDNYLKCPWRFFYNNLLLFPSIKNNQMIFGTAVHGALDAFIKKRKLIKDPTKFLIENFREGLNKEFLSESEKKVLLVKGEKALAGYFEQVIKPNWGEDILSEISIRGVRIDEGIILNGRLDMIEPNGKSGQVIVHDFKTGKPKSRGMIDGTKEDSNYNYLRQLTFYKILLDNYRQGSMTMVEGVVDFVEQDEKGRFKSERFEISDNQVKVLIDQIKFVSREIMELEFWDRRCEDEDCEFCKLRELTM